MVDFSNVGVSENGGFSPQIIHFNRNFHYKSWILGAHPYFWKHLYVIFVFRAVFVTMFLVSRTSEVKMPMSSLWIDIILIERAAWLTSIQKMTLVFCIAGNFLCPGKSGWEPRGAGRFFWDFPMSFSYTQRRSVLDIFRLWEGNFLNQVRSQQSSKTMGTFLNQSTFFWKKR